MVQFWIVEMSRYNVEPAKFGQKARYDIYEEFLFNNAFDGPKDAICFSNFLSGLFTIDIPVSLLDSYLLIAEHTHLLLQPCFILARMSACCIATALGDLEAEFAIDLPELILRKDVTIACVVSLIWQTDILYSINGCLCEII